MLEVEALKEEVREMKRTEEGDMPGPKTRGRSSKGPSKSAKMGAVTPPSQESIQENTKSSISNRENEISAAQSQASKSPTLTQAKSNTRPQLGKRSYASVAISNPAQVPEQPWTQVKYKNRKPSQQHPIKSTLKAKHQGRRILFPRKTTGRQMSEADLMLVLNEALAKAGEGVDICFSRVRYLPSGAVFALLIEKANAGLLVPRLSNTLIQAAKTVDAAIVGVEILEHWQRLKVHRMSLYRYLDEGKMGLLKQEVESSTGIQLKALPRWLINENRLRE